MPALTREDVRGTREPTSTAMRRRTCDIVRRAERQRGRPEERQNRTSCPQTSTLRPPQPGFCSSPTDDRCYPPGFRSVGVVSRCCTRLPLLWQSVCMVQVQRRSRATTVRAVGCESRRTAVGGLRDVRHVPPTAPPSSRVAMSSHSAQLRLPPSHLDADRRRERITVRGAAPRRDMWLSRASASVAGLRLVVGGALAIHASMWPMAKPRRGRHAVTARARGHAYRHREGRLPIPFRRSRHREAKEVLFLDS
ncbi:hypothetical protein MTO96_006747 [Rhipicephalus appendiculatus]